MDLCLFPGLNWAVHLCNHDTNINLAFYYLLIKHIVSHIWHLSAQNNSRKKVEQKQTSAEMSFILPKRERTPHSTHTSRDNPTLPLFIRTPFGAMKIPLPTTVPMMKDMAGSSPICLRRHTTSSSLLSVSLFPLFFILVPFISLCGCRSQGECAGHCGRKKQHRL